ncbi:MAG: hypothetical protein AB7O24_14935 [Kofleriaceae bacterium]
MKKMSIVVALVTAVTLAFAACGKKNPPAAPAAPTEGAPTEGAPTEGAPTEGAPTEGAPADAGSGSAM